jgi:hypothetical protein
MLAHFQLYRPASASVSEACPEGCQIARRLRLAVVGDSRTALFEEPLPTLDEQLVGLAAESGLPMRSSFA